MRNPQRISHAPNKSTTLLKSSDVRDSYSSSQARAIQYPKSIQCHSCWTIRPISHLSWCIWCTACTCQACRILVCLPNTRASPYKSLVVRGGWTHPGWCYCLVDFFRSRAKRRPRSKQQHILCSRRLGTPTSRSTFVRRLSKPLAQFSHQTS